MTKHWPPPNIKPLERLQVTDGLLIDASRWRVAHEYHRLRQNVNFQSLNQPGIVCDLGVKLIPPPAYAQPSYRDNRWLQIQPGIAIDMFGNFIVVNEPMDFRISTSITGSGPVTVYLVVSYVDPEKTHRNDSGEIVKESFRIDEKTTPPQSWEVEVCRIRMLPGEVSLSNPKDVFFPTENDLDLRYRSTARWRPISVVRVGVSHPGSTPPQGGEQGGGLANFTSLLQSAGSLYHQLQGADEIWPVFWRNEAKEKQQLWECDLVYITYEQLQELKETEQQIFEEYLKAGGVVLVEASIKGTQLEQMLDLKVQLQDALLDLRPTDNNQSKKEIELELQALEVDLNREISQFCASVTLLVQKLGLDGDGRLNRNHPLRNEPFLFAQFPVVDDLPVQVFNWGGLVLVLGELSRGWGLDEELLLHRETIRTAQEMGVNLLHFAWRRHQLTLLLQQGKNKT